MRAIYRSLVGGLFEKEIPDHENNPPKEAVFPYYSQGEYRMRRFRLVGVTPESIVSYWAYAIYEEVDIR